MRCHTLIFLSRRRIARRHWLRYLHPADSLDHALPKFCLLGGSVLENADYHATGREKFILQRGKDTDLLGAA